MKRRYLAATVVALFTAASMIPQTSFSWQSVTGVAIFAALLLGAHTVDRYVEAMAGVSAGPVSVDASANDGGEDATE